MSDGDDAPESASPESFVELGPSGIPTWLPRPAVRKGDGDVTWFYGAQGARELYVHRVMGAGRYRVTVLACERVDGAAGALPVWPTLEEIWSALGVCPVGAIFQLPGHAVGMVPNLEGAVVTITTCNQVGAIAGSPAFLRWSLANPGGAPQ